MKHILKVALLFCSSLPSASMLCGQSLPASLMSWQGEWITERPGGTIHERWTIVDNKVMQGSSWLIKTNADSAYQESIKLYAESDSVIYYSPFVPAQHSAPVPFRLIRQGDSEWLFHNAENDFPKYIGYQMFNYDRLTARIGNDSTFSEKPFVIFDFKKIK
jgi:hypothetical protein